MLRLSTELEEASTQKSTMTTFTVFLCVVTLTFDLFDPKYIGLQDSLVDHICVKLDDPSCIII